MNLEGRAEGKTLRGKVSELKTLRGYSAYELAVIHGFSGTEEEWVASLKGEKGDNGGYYVPYYHEATGELMFSPTRSDMEFVGSVGVIRGERGATGEKGEKGEKGDKGDPGELPAVSKTVTLTASQWAERSGDGIMYELPFEGMTATTTVICSVAPDLAMEQEVLRCMVRCVIQEDGYLWFKALSGEAPTIDIDMNILAMG